MLPNCVKEKDIFRDIRDEGGISVLRSYWIDRTSSSLLKRRIIPQSIKRLCSCFNLLQHFFSFFRSYNIYWHNSYERNILYILIFRLLIDKNLLESDNDDDKFALFFLQGTPVYPFSKPWAYLVVHSELLKTRVHVPLLGESLAMLSNTWSDCHSSSSEWLSLRLEILLSHESATPLLRPTNTSFDDLAASSALSNKSLSNLQNLFIALFISQ